MGRQTKPSGVNNNNGLPKWLTAVSFFIGVASMILILILVVFIRYPTPAQYIIFRIILSLGGAAFSMPLTGFLTVNMSISSKVNIVAGGALAVFIILYFFSPKLIGPMTPYRITSLNETVDFQKWKPWLNKNEKTSPVIREEKYFIESTGSDQRNFEDFTGTTNVEIGLDIEILSDGASYQVDPVPQVAPRKTYTITLPHQSFSKEGKGNLNYRVTYWNVFVLDKPTTVGNPFTDITKYIRYPMDNYSIKCFFKSGLTYKKITRSLVHEGNRTNAEYRNQNNSLIFENKMESLSPGDVITYYFDIV